MRRLPSWIWTFVGFGVGLILGFNWSITPNRAFFDVTTVVLCTLAGVVASVVVYVRAQDRSRSA